MTEIQILFQLEKFYGETMTLKQALEAMGRITATIEILGDGDWGYDKTQLILEIADEVMDEEE